MERINRHPEDIPWCAYYWRILINYREPYKGNTNAGSNNNNKMAKYGTPRRLYIYINSSRRIQLNTTSTTKNTIVEGIKEIVKNFVMALINLRFVCLMALLLISTTCLTSQVSGRNNIGTFLSRRAYQLYYREICGFREPDFILLLDSPVFSDIRLK